MMQGKLPEGWDSDIPEFSPDAKGMATRVASGKVMNAIASKLPTFIGGSADLDPSTHTALAGEGDFESPQETIEDPQGSVGGGWKYSGNNLHFGIREHAMGAILNGIALSDLLIPYGATFFVFLDYMRGAVRLAALQHHEREFRHRLAAIQGVSHLKAHSVRRSAHFRDDRIAGPQPGCIPLEDGHG